LNVPGDTADGFSLTDYFMVVTSGVGVIGVAKRVTPKNFLVHLFFLPKKRGGRDYRGNCARAVLGRATVSGFVGCAVS